MGLNLDISGLEGKCSMHKLQSRRLLEYSMKQSMHIVNAIGSI